MINNASFLEDFTKLTYQNCCSQVLLMKNGHKDLMDVDVLPRSAYYQLGHISLLHQSAYNYGAP